LLLSPPTSYPLPLLSLTTHLALLATRLPRLVSEGDEDPLFDDDWEASVYLYPLQQGSSTARVDKPAITLLVAMVGDNILFDPSKEELAAAEGVVALSAGEETSAVSSVGGRAPEGGVMLGIQRNTPTVNLLAVRTIDPPSRLTPLGVPNAINSAAGGVAPVTSAESLSAREGIDAEGVWAPPRGGVKRSMISRAIKAMIEPGGVAHEVMEGLELFTKS
jgi:exosome complex component RRP42